MLVKNYLSKNYQITDAYSGTKAIKEQLINNNYLVVFENDTFRGILTPVDLLERPHNLVIDCLCEKDRLNVNDGIFTALEKFSSNNLTILPIFEQDNFIGVIEKEKITRTLIEKVDKLYKKSLISEKTKISFMNTLSHEIRTPLNVILGFLKILAELDKDEYNKNKKEYFNIIQKNTNSFLLVMNDIIELALIYSGEKVKLYKEKFILKNVFLELKNIFDDSVNKERNVNIDYIDDNLEIQLNTDRERIKHIFYHLVNNAVKFSSNNSSIVYGVNRVVKSNIVFFVKNTGSTIAREDVSRIFKIFEKNDYTDSKIYGGLGIGLNVVTILTKALGGGVKITVNSQNEPTFYFWIPIDDNT